LILFLNFYYTKKFITREEKYMEQKKGIQLNQAFGAVLTLVLVAVLVIVAIVIFVSLSTSFTGTESSSVTGESVTPTDAGVSLGATSNCSSGDFAFTNVTNSTGGPAIDSGNYTLTSAGVLTNLTSEFVDSSWTVGYTYTWGSEACTASENMTTEFGNYTSLIGLVGTIIFLGLVIGVLVASFVFGRREV
jgi:hypothetical protein